MAEEINQSVIDELKEEIEALKGKNKELLTEKKKLKMKYDDVDIEEFSKLQDKYDNLEAEYKKLEKSHGTLTKDFEKTSQALSEKDENLRKMLVDDGIAKALNSLEKHKLNDGALELATLAIKNKGVELIDGIPMVGDKALNEYITNDFLQDPVSKNLVTPNPNMGGGANGGNGNGGNPTQGKLDGTKAEQEAYIKAKFGLDK